MAYVLPAVYQVGTEGVNSTSVTFEAWFTPTDGLEAGDYIMVCASNQTGLNELTLTGATGSWTRLGNADSPRVGTTLRSQIWWHKYDGTTLPTAPIVAGGSSAAWVAAAWVVRDAPDVANETWIDVSARVDNNSAIRIHPISSVTTTEADCLLLTVFTAGGVSTGTATGAFETPNNFWGMDFSVLRAADNSAASTSTQRVIVASRAQFSAGATPSYDYVSGVANGVRSQYWVIAIKNKVGGSKPIGILNPPIRVTDYFENNTFTTGASVFTSLSTIHATIDGQSTFAPATIGNVSSTQGLITNNPPILFWYRTFSLSPPAATTGVSGVRWDLPAATDYTTGLWTLFVQRASAAQDSLAGIYHYFEDNNGNWAVYQFLTRIEGALFNTLIRHLPDETAIDGSVTPVDLSDITKRGVAYRQTTANTAARAFIFGRECIQPFSSPLTLIGGGPDNPITARTVAQMLDSGAGWRLAFAQGQGQQVITMPYQLGDGTVATYVDDEAQALEYPSVGGVLGYSVQDGRQEIRIKASASDTILLDAGIKGTALPHLLTFDAATNTSATYGMAGTFLGWVPTLKTGLTLRGGTYIRCDKIDAKGADVSDSTVKNSIATDAAMRLENTADASGSAFTKGAETYAIEIAGTGTVTLEEVTYTGYTTPINVLAISGTVTIELAPGDTQPAFDTAGATVVFAQALQTQSVTVLNGVAGTLLLIQDVTNPAAPITLYLDTPPTWPHTWTDPSPYVADRDIRVRAAFQSGTAAKIFIDEEIGTSTNAAPALSYRLNQVDDEVYIANAIDGSTVTDVVIDDAALLVEVDTGTISWDAIYAYEVYWLATAAGIIDEGRIITALDTANYLFEGPWKIKNISSPMVALVITGGYGRSKVDGTTLTLIDTTGGTIFSNPDQVIAFAVGSAVTTQDKTDIIDGVWNAALASYQSSGSTGEALDAAATSGGGGGGSLTAADVWTYADRQLTASIDPSAAAIALQVRTELATELARVDVAISSRNAVAPPSAADNATQVRAELATELARVDVAVSSRLADASYTAPPSAADNATAVLAAAAAAPIAADAKRMNAATIHGTGTPADLWRGTP